MAHRVLLVKQFAALFPRIMAMKWRPNTIIQIYGTCLIEVIALTQSKVVKMKLNCKSCAMTRTKNVE